MTQNCFSDFAPVRVRSYGPWRTWANHIYSMCNLVKFPRIQTVQKDRVSKPSHAARLLQPSYDRLDSFDGKKPVNCRPISSDGPLLRTGCCRIFSCQRSKGHHFIMSLGQPHVPATFVANAKCWFANRYFQLLTSWQCNADRTRSFIRIPTHHISPRFILHTDPTKQRPKHATLYCVQLIQIRCG